MERNRDNSEVRTVVMFKPNAMSEVIRFYQD